MIMMLCRIHFVKQGARGKKASEAILCFLLRGDPPGEVLLRLKAGFGAG